VEEYWHKHVLGDATQFNWNNFVRNDNFVTNDSLWCIFTTTKTILKLYVFLTIHSQSLIKLNEENKVFRFFSASNISKLVTLQKFRTFYQF
jgi:hypothetical protein